MKVRLVYEQVRDRIREDASHLSPDEALPSEMEYMRRLEVSRYTIRKAVDELVDAGLIRRIPNKGLVAAGRRAENRGLRFLISLPFVVEDSDYFKTLMGCIEESNRLEIDYKIIGFTDVEERLRAIEAENLSEYSGAVISCYESSADEMTLARLQASGVPLVTMGHVRPNIPHVCDDSYGAGYLIAKHLLKNGHRDIVYLTSDRPVRDVQLREKGFLQALRDYDMPIRGAYILTCKDPGTPLSLSDAEQRELPAEAEAFLSGARTFTALAGYSAIPLMAMCKRMARKGLRVPEDVSVMGYGSSLYLAEANLPLSSVGAPNYEMGACCIRALHDCLTGKTQHVVSKMLPSIFMGHKSVRTIKWE